jgi:uncharacterized protein with GYD domain
MPLYMAQFAYTPEAWATLIQVPQDRAAASDALVRHFGGRLIGLYYTPGAEYDGFALFEAPDDASAAAIEIADVAAGHLRSNRLLRVLSAEEMQTALQQAATAPAMMPKRRTTG